MTTVLRVIKFAGQNILRNFWLSVITVSMMTFTLLSVNVLVALSLVADRAIAYVEDKVEVSVYFKAEATEAHVADAAGFLRALEQVRDVRVTTSDEALERFKARHERDATVLASLQEIGKNPFGPTLVVKARAPGDFPFIMEALDRPQFADDVREKDFTDYQGVIDRIRETTDRARAVGVTVAGTFFAIALLIVFNTVRLGLVIHREEIGIMKLVGATSAFVRTPFLVETVLLSLVATLVSAALVIPAVAAADPALGAFFDGAATLDLLGFYRREGIMVFGIQFAVLAATSMIATGFAMRKYLRV
ncbi:FtsX-like permease family protein [Patescibacteria group bacterium]|nr:MAG: FtsX-like permease family protein [Patescibacteria group bacterium]